MFSSPVSVFLIKCHCFHFEFQNLLSLFIPIVWAINSHFEKEEEELFISILSLEESGHINKTININAGCFTYFIWILSSGEQVKSFSWIKYQIAFPFSF